MEDPLQALFTGGMAWGQYDEAKRFNEAMKQQAESGGEYDYTVTDDVVENIFSDAPLVTAAKGGGAARVLLLAKLSLSPQSAGILELRVDVS